MAGILVTVAAMVTLAGSDAIAKHLATTYAVVQILWVRYLLYAAYGVAHARRAAATGRLRSQRPGLQIVRGSVLVASNLAVVYSFSQLPLADVHALIAVSPLVVTAASALFLGERVGRRRWLAVSAGFAGILVILRPGLGVFDPVALTPLLGAALYSTYQILTKHLSRHDGQATTQLYTGLCGLAWFSALVPFAWADPDAAGWLGLGAAAAAGTLAHVLIIKGLHLAPASTVQPFNYTMLVAAAVFGYLVFGHVPDAPTLIGAAAVVASGLYAFHRERREAGRAT